MKTDLKCRKNAGTLQLTFGLCIWILAALILFEPGRANAADSCNLSLAADFSNLPEPVIVGGNALTVSRGTPGRTGFFTTLLPAQLNISGVTGSPVVMQVDDSSADPLFKINNSGTIALGKLDGSQQTQINSTQTVITSTPNFANLNIGDETTGGSARITGQLQFSPYSTSQVAIGNDSGGGGLALGIPTGTTPATSSQFVIRGPDAGASGAAISAALLIENADGTKLLTVTDDGRVGIGRNPESVNRPLQGKAPNFNDPNRWPGAALEVNGPMQVSSGFVILTPLPAGTPGPVTGFTLTGLTLTVTYGPGTPPASAPPCIVGSDSDGVVVLTANHGLCVCQVTSTAAKWLSARNGIASCVWN